MNLIDDIHGAFFPERRVVIVFSSDGIPEIQPNLFEDSTRRRHAPGVECFRLVNAPTSAQTLKAPLRSRPRLPKEAGKTQGDPAHGARYYYAVVEKNGSGRASTAAESCPVLGAVTSPSKPTTVKVAELEVPPPGAGLNTVIVRCPTLSMSLFEI